MKDQYFGDINDFRKYAILRAIGTAANLQLGVCWMLTTPDGRTDGRRLSYLNRPDRYRRFDPELFDCLSAAVAEPGDRRTAHMEWARLLGEARFHSDLISDDRASRQMWFAVCLNVLSGCDLIFFDPDNGLERSVLYGCRNSCKFLYWHEVRETFGGGPSVLAYQHFPREPRDEFSRLLSARLRIETGASAVFSFRTPHVLFVLASHERHADSIRAGAAALKASWPATEIDVREH